VEAVRDLAGALSIVRDNSTVNGRDLAAFGLVVEILTSDAAAILEAAEGARMRSEEASP
jgi:hypothetical protein